MVWKGNSECAATPSAGPRRHPSSILPVTRTMEWPFAARPLIKSMAWISAPPARPPRQRCENSIRTFIANHSRWLSASRSEDTRAVPRRKRKTAARWGCPFDFAQGRLARNVRRSIKRYYLRRYCCAGALAGIWSAGRDVTCGTFGAFVTWPRSASAISMLARSSRSPVARSSSSSAFS